MKITVKKIFMGLIAVGLGVSAKAAENSFNIIPAPESLKPLNGSFVISGNTEFGAKDKEAAKVAEFFAEKMKLSTGFNFSVTNGKPKHGIRLVLSKKIKGEEAYTLDVTEKGVVAVASTPKGLFYAMQTFLQILPPQVESPKRVTNAVWKAQAVSIKDKPRFDYRGAMIDACRHFYPVDMIKHHIDVLSMFKINNLHLHLTEDQGWRIEIKKYPKLTEIGAWRTDDTGAKYGGYYTQEELKDIVKYAQEHFINIVPEFEMPGHELAAIAAYPWLSCRDVKISTRPSWGIEDIVMCPGKETTFTFLQDVIDEITKIFPSPYYHIGGDESPRVEWKNCPLCQKRADDLGLKEDSDRTREDQLQSYVVSRMEKYLNEKYHKSIIGWDEILKGGNLNKTAIVMSWRGEKGGIAGAKAGHKVIMSPSKDGLYLDYYQGDALIEPFGIGRYNPLEKTYNYDPVPAEVEKEGKADMIWGPQGNLWTEYIESAEKFDYRFYPRTIAIAETGWSPKAKKNFADFSRRLDGDAATRLSEHNVNYHIPLPEQPNGSYDFLTFTDKTAVAFQTTRPEKMVYTLDGTNPTPNSAVYTKPLEFSQTGTIKIATLLPSGFMSKTRTVYVEKQNLAPAVPTANLEKGLKLKISYDTYTCVSDLFAAENWETKTIKSLDEMNRQAVIPKNGRDIKNYGALSEGFVNIPADGIYYFQSNLPTIWIDGQKVVETNGVLPAYHDAGGRTMALKAGMHRLRCAFLGLNFDGRPTFYNKGYLHYRLGDSGEFKDVTPEMLFH